ncbi:MAG: threonine/serine dehydratase [Synergistaceae bacterium]|jgi:threonine dehydratase|nr:threonine/serine dehydratase [Synergistaceae bacterium]
MDALAFDPSFKDVVKAYRLLKSRVRHTPTEYSHALSEAVGAPVYVKWENRQFCGSFKIRGAFYRMDVLNEEERVRGVVTCSSGNHGQGVALAAREMKLKAVVFVPQVCPEVKKQAIRRLGGDGVRLVVAGGDFDFADQEAVKYSKETGATYISSFEDPYLIAGQGTAGLEMFMDEPELDYLVVPAGGGGLINGIAIAAKAVNPEVEIFGVQSVASNPWVASWAGGKVKSVEYLETLADGLAGAIPQSLLTLAKRRISDIFEVTEEDIRRAIAFIHKEHRQVIEGAGAVGVAALLTGKANPQGKRTGVFISGGNIDSDRLKEILAEY